MSSWCRAFCRRAKAEDWLFSLFIALIGLSLRVAAVLAFAREPVWDGHYYHFGAERIAAGLGYSEDVLVGGVPVWKPWCHYPVGYSAFLAAAYKVFGSGLLVGPLCNAVTGALLVVAAHRLARRFLSSGRARVAALLTALHPGLIIYAAVLMTEPLAALSLLLAGLCAFSGSRWGSMLAGSALGLGALVRPPSLLAAPLLFLAFGAPWRKSALKTLIAGACALLVILPWTLRNCRVMDGCALVSTNGGWNLAIGALSPTGRFHPLTAADGCKIVTGQVQQDRCWAEVGAELIAKDPVAWLRKVPLKLEHTYNHESFAVAYLGEANPSQWSPARREIARNSITLFHHLLMVLASLAWVSRATRQSLKSQNGRVQLGLLALLAAYIAYGAWDDTHPLYWLAVLTPLLAFVPLPGRPQQDLEQARVGRFLGGLILITSYTQVVFFGEDRYHLVISPVLCILAAAALRQSNEQGTLPRVNEL